MFLVKTATSVASVTAMPQSKQTNSFFLVNPIQIVIGDVIDI